MSRSRLEPLGVPSYAGGEQQDIAGASNGEPTKLDRWLVAQLRKQLGDAPIRLELWDKTSTPTQTTVRFRDRGALVKLILNPELQFGDLYSAGRIELYGSLDEVLENAYRVVADTTTLARALRRWRRLSTPDLAQSRRNIHHHYDIGNEFYTLWLDTEALQYTCAYYPEEAMTIEAAQQAKMHHVCRKLWLKPGDSVVEAGCGWGGFALFMAKEYGVKVRAFNISHEQIVHAREWAKQQGLSERVEFVEDDYRNISGEYDAFVSIGMLEHVGRGNYEDMGKLMNRSLKPGGRGLIHSIGRDKPVPLNPWIAKRIFPGGYPPTLREMMNLFEPNGLSVLDVENLRLHYAKTLEAWLERYEENVETIKEMFDDAFVRAWRLYLAGSKSAFRMGTLQLFQILFTRGGFNQIPATRARLYS